MLFPLLVACLPGMQGRLRLVRKKWVKIKNKKQKSQQNYVSGFGKNKKKKKNFIFFHILTNLLIKGVPATETIQKVHRLYR